MSQGGERISSGKSSIFNGVEVGKKVSQVRNLTSSPFRAICFTVTAVSSCFPFVVVVLWTSKCRCLRRWQPFLGCRVPLSAYACVYCQGKPLKIKITTRSNAALAMAEVSNLEQIRAKNGAGAFSRRFVGFLEFIDDYNGR